METIFSRAVALFWLITVCSALAYADVGIVLYQSKGSDSRLTGTGHLSLITTSLCADGIENLRRCADAEEPGAIITHYANVAAGYERTVFVAPIQAHFTATDDGMHVPTLSNGGALEAMQIEYWRRNLKSYLPVLSIDQYNAILQQEKKFDGGRILRRAITLEYLVKLLGPRKKRDPIALVDPVTKEMIPDGRWRDVLGVQYTRSSIVITVQTTPEQEARLLSFVNGDHGDFNALTNNCSDFVSRALELVFGDSGFRLRPRPLHFADAWITTPIAVTTALVSFAWQERLPLEVEQVPQIAGTRRPSAAVMSIGRGALVPRASQGRTSFVLKTYFNWLNPLLGLTSFGVDKASRFADPEKLVHERGNADLSRITNARVLRPETSGQGPDVLKREQMKTFGTSSCWSRKKQQFALLESAATREGVLSPVERSLLLKEGQPFLLPRLYESMADAGGHEGELFAGMQLCAAGGCGVGVVESFLPKTAELDELSNRSETAFVPDRSEITEMANSTERRKQVMAFKLMTAVINYDLSSEPISRRTTDEFDPDWQLLLEIANRNSLSPGDGDSTRESVRACSNREFEGGAKIDAYQRDMSLEKMLMRQIRGMMYGANR